MNFFIHCNLTTSAKEINFFVLVKRVYLTMCIVSDSLLIFIGIVRCFAF